MTKDFVTMGKDERKVVLKWYMKTSVDSLKKARFMVLVKTALDEINYDYIVSPNSELTKLERILFITYNVAIGKYNFNDVVKDNCRGGSVFKLVDTENGDLAIINF